MVVEEGGIVLPCLEESHENQNSMMYHPKRLETQRDLTQRGEHMARTQCVPVVASQQSSHQRPC